MTFELATFGVFYRVHALHSKKNSENHFQVWHSLWNCWASFSASMLSGAFLLVGCQVQGTSESQGTLSVGVSSTSRFVCLFQRCLMQARLALALPPPSSPSRCWHSGVPQCISAPSTQYPMQSSRGLAPCLILESCCLCFIFGTNTFINKCPSCFPS